MEPTRRGLAAAGCALGLVAGALVLAAPMLLLAAAGLLAWLLGVQLAFARALGRERDSLAVEVATQVDRPIVGQSIPLEVSVRSTGLVPLHVEVPVPAPAKAEGDLVVAVNETSAGVDDPVDPARGGAATDRTATTLEWRVAGTYRVGLATVEATDPLGLFTATFEAGHPIEVEVRPRTPDTAHLGVGTDSVAVFGEHSTGHTGTGIEPGELRPYHPGDDVARIDWNATARLREAYVADSEAETDRRTVLLVDHRATSRVGADGETPWAFLRHAALAVVESAREVGDPIGLYGVGDGGVTAAHPPRASRSQYDVVGDELRGLAPTAAEPGDGRGRPTAADGGATAGRSRGGAGGRLPPTAGDPAHASRAAGRLVGDDSPFARTLQPLLADAEPYLHRVAAEPLFAAARTYLGRLQGTLWTVICADDARPGELRETVKLARRGHDRVLVLLAPRSLYGLGGTGDLASRYRAYTASASFQRSLAAMERVAVRELAPGDAVEAVLAAGGERS